MNDYRGTMAADDPLAAVLAELLDGQAGAGEPVEREFHVYALDANEVVYRYEDRQKQRNLVAKFYGRKWIDASQSGGGRRRSALMHHEFQNLRFACSLDLDARRHRVVRPYAVRETLDYALIEEFASGTNLEAAVMRAIGSGSVAELSGRIDDVAWFLADLHDVTSFGVAQSPDPALGYFDEQFHAAVAWDICTTEQGRQLRGLTEGWAQSGLLATGDTVIVHGDATPTNFLWRGDHDLAVIDLECLHASDRARDLGCVAAELKHLFWWHAHDPWASEPYIRRLYSGYSDATHGPSSRPEDLTERGRFFMACSLLRLALNDWLPLDYRRRLIDEAISCLRI